MSEESLIKTPTVFGENGNFLLERELGMGGMGGVYLGRDKMLDRPVAVKVMLKEYGSDAEFVEKFKREAQAAARLIHPNIAQIYSYGISDGMPYIAIERDRGAWELVPAGYSKGTGIGLLRERLGVPREACYAFGDSRNDLAMFAHAGVSIAMGNASDDVKAACGYVTGRPEEYGIAAAMKHFGLI